MITTQGMHMPKLGLGTGQLRGAAGQQAIEQALGIGYRHLDTAEMYTNEATVGAAIKASGVPRADIHVTTKVLAENLAPVALRAAIERSLEALATDYVDLYLIHWPRPSMDLPRALEAMMRLRDEGRARAIGVSNFPVALMRQAVEDVRAPLACNQVEYHLQLDQSAVLGYARSKGISVTAYAPLARGQAIAYPEIAAIAKKHRATPAQVALKWLLDQDLVAAIPRTARPETQRANLDAARLQLDDEDRRKIAGLPKTRRVVDPDYAPMWDPPVG